MDTKRIEALRAEMQGKYRMESVSVGTLSYLLDALLAPAASEPADLPVGFLADVSREVEERIAQRPEWQRRALEERLRRVERKVKANEPAQEPERCDDTPARGEAGEPVREAERELTIVELRVQNADLRARLAAAERARKNHAETLIGIASMDPSDGKRMRMWAKDGLSGYKEPVESTVLKLSDERNAAVQRAEAAERRVEELTATLQKMAEGPCWFDGDENVEWDADGRCSEEACCRCVAQHTLAAALAKGDAK